MADGTRGTSVSMEGVDFLVNGGRAVARSLDSIGSCLGGSAAMEPLAAAVALVTGRPLGNSRASLASAFGPAFLSVARASS